MSIETWASVIGTGAGLVSGLIAAFVSLQSKALVAMVRQEMAQLENRIVERINGAYVRTGECKLRHVNVDDKIDVLAEELRRRPGH